MRPFRAAALLVALLPLASAPAAAQNDAFGTAPRATVERGARMERAAAERAVAFRPFVPDTAPVEVMLLPPFHSSSARGRSRDGIAYTYGRHGRGWVLSEWPRNGGSLTAFAPLPPEPGCATVHAVGGKAKPRGIVWSTPRGLVMSLIPDGSAEPPTIRAEFRRLVRRGACR